jgi:hypothetical protein
VKKSPKCSQAHFCQKNTYSTYTLEKVAPKMWATYIIFQKLPKVRKFAQPGHLVWKQKAFFFIFKKVIFSPLYRTWQLSLNICLAIRVTILRKAPFSARLFLHFKQFF